MYPTETLGFKTPNKLTVNGCSGEPQVSQNNNAFRTILRFFLIKSFIAKEIYMHGAHSGFNLKLKSI